MSAARSGARAVVRYDDDDPYLVVAADKGTASFSDIANDVAAEYGFWLGDAFASGGRHGYDHKAMGITARGAWESVKRHFRSSGATSRPSRSRWSESATCPVTCSATACSAPSTPGCSRPSTTSTSSWIRTRIPRPATPSAGGCSSCRASSWSDYDPQLISERWRRVRARAPRSIALSAEVRCALGIKAERLTPAELIRELLRAPVDLLFNGGIGTYVKARGGNATPSRGQGQRARARRRG